jgi:hypothetical protein
MRTQRHPNPVVATVTVFALVLAGCSINIKPTDLSAVTIANDRAVIEQKLGKPNREIAAQGFVAAAYRYDKGHYDSQPLGGSGCCGAEYRPPYDSGDLLIGLPLLLIIKGGVYAAKYADASAEQTGVLALIYDAESKLVFAGTLENPEITPKKLKDVPSLYASAQSGNACPVRP